MALFKIPNLLLRTPQTKPLPLFSFSNWEREGKEGGRSKMPMPRRRNPIQKLKKALAMVISRKILTQKLVLLKRNKKYNKFFRHYDYGYISAYQFSPSNDTPLISSHHHHGHSGFWKKRRSCFLYLLCGGAGVGSMIETNLDFGQLAPLPMEKATEERRVVEELEGNGGDDVGEIGEEGEGDDDSSVDERAQRFIERFYEEIRLERQQSLVQWKEMLQRSC